LVHFFTFLRLFRTFYAPKAAPPYRVRSGRPAWLWREYAGGIPLPKANARRQGILSL